MDENELERHPHYTETQTKLKEQLVVRKYMDVNEHGITLRHKLR